MANCSMLWRWLKGGPILLSDLYRDPRELVLRSELKPICVWGRILADPPGLRKGSKSSDHRIWPIPVVGQLGRRDPTITRATCILAGRLSLGFHLGASFCVRRRLGLREEGTESRLRTCEPRFGDLATCLYVYWRKK